MKLINLPNILTCCNLLCGCLAIKSGLQFDIVAAGMWIIIGALFDFGDGLVARAMHISGPIGKELDSLADVVTFGVAPAALCYSLLRTLDVSDVLANVAFVVAAFSALRLAKFNIDTRQTTSFIGLPTPANALLWIGICHLASLDAVRTALQPWIVYVLIAITSWLLICELPMFSLKIKSGHMGWRENALRYSFLIACLPLAVFGLMTGAAYATLAFIIALYIIMSAIAWFTQRK